MYHPPEYPTIYNIQYQRAFLLRCLIPLLPPCLANSPDSAFLGDQTMPNDTPPNPQPGIYPIPAALPPAFPLHMYNPPMPYSYIYTSNPLSLPQTPIATRELGPHTNSERDAPSFELDFAARLFEGVIPGQQVEEEST